MKPILFNAEMVRAIQDGRKTVTRRLVKEKTEYPLACRAVYNPVGLMTASGIIRPNYEIGDILYVRETFFEYKGHYHYKADGKHTALDKLVGGSFFKWHPSIHMPKEAARIFLRVTGVRVERLQDITDDQAIDEGCKGVFANVDWVSIPREEYVDVWNSTVKKTDLNKYGWNANPWVWVIEFERISKEEAYSG